MYRRARLPGVAGDRALAGTGHTSYKEGIDEKVARTRDGRCRHVLGRAVAGRVCDRPADTDRLHRHGRSSHGAAGDRRPG